jgi:hypothetical protein
MKTGLTCTFFVLLISVSGYADPILDANYPPTSGGGGIIVERFNSGTLVLDLAQTFTVLNTGTLTSVAMEMWNLDGYTTPVQVDIRTVDGSGVPFEADSGSGILASAEIPGGSIPTTPTFVETSFAGINVTAGEQLAITLSEPAFGDQVWTGDLDLPTFGYNAGTYTDGQAYWRGSNASTPSGLGSSTWTDIYLFNSPGVPTGGGPNADFGFEVFVDTGSQSSDVPEPMTLVLFGPGLIAVLHRLKRRI